MKITIYETLLLLESLGVECVQIKNLRETFFKQEEPPQTLPELPTPPQPPGKPSERTFESYKEAKAAANKGETPAYDDKLKRFVNVK